MSNLTVKRKTAGFDGELGSLASGIPQLRFTYEEMQKLTPQQRVGKMIEAFVTANVSAFAKGAVMHRLVDYWFDAVMKRSPTMAIWQNTIHSLINLYEMDSVFQSVITVEHAEVEANFDEQDQMMRMLLGHLSSKYFNDNPMTFSHYDGYAYNEMSYRDLISTLTNLDKDVAEKFDLKLEYSETFEDDGDKKSISYLFIVLINGQRIAFYASKRKSRLYDFDTLDFYFVYSRVDSPSLDDISTLLSTVIRANFLSALHPEKYIIEMAQYTTNVVPRRVSFNKMPNIKLNEIRTSIQKALDKKHRRVIAMVGDAGLGKTEAMHSIINSFPHLPTYIVTPSALGTSPSPSTIKSIFDSVRMVDSILVFDDFEGFGVKDKDETTNEFLRQFDGTAGWNGIAILIVNDPSKVHHTLINRPGRVDSVYEISYLSNFDDIASVLNAHFPSIVFDEKSYRASFKMMVNHHFSTARMVRAVEFMTEHFEDAINATSFTESIKRLHEFEQIAMKEVSEGRLIDERNYQKKRNRHLTPACSPRGSKRVYDDTCEPEEAPEISDWKS